MGKKRPFMRWLMEMETAYEEESFFEAIADYNNKSLSSELYLWAIGSEENEDEDEYEDDPWGDDYEEEEE